MSEFFPEELALIMNCSRSEATRLTTASWTLFHRLPETWAALADGVSRPPGTTFLEPYELGTVIPEAEIVELIPF